MNSGNTNPNIRFGSLLSFNPEAFVLVSAAAVVFSTAHLTVLLELQAAFLERTPEDQQVDVKNSMVCGHIAFSNAASFGRLDSLRQCKEVESVFLFASHSAEH